MLLDLKYILPKILVILIILLAYYLIDKYYHTNVNTIETFAEKIEKEKNNYLKLKETNIEADGTTLDLLYVNYVGEEVNKDIWEGKTFD